MKFKELDIAGAWLIEPELASDERGVFRRHFCSEEFELTALRRALCRAMFPKTRTYTRYVGFTTSLRQSNCAVTRSRLTCGRVFFVYGPGQRPSSLIPLCYDSLKHGVAPKITNPLAINNFIHVADVAAAICKLVGADDGTGIYNMGSGRPFAVWEVVNFVATEMGLAPVYHDMPPSTGGVWADITRMSLLGWQPELSLQAGIARTLNRLAADQ